MQHIKQSEKILGYLMILNSLLLLVPNKFKAYPILALLLFSVFYSMKTTFRTPFPIKKVLIISCLFIVFLLGTFNSLLFKASFPKLSTMASLLAFPIIFGLLQSSGYHISKGIIIKVFKAFTLSVILFILISFITFWNREFTFSETIVHYSNLINKGLKAYAIHPIYLSIYIGVSILTLIHLIKITTSQSQKIISLLTLIFFVIVMAVLMRRGPIIYLTIAAAFLLQSYFQFKKTIVGVIIMLFLIAGAIQFLPKYKDKNRFADFTNNALSSDKSSSVGIRYVIYQCGIEKILAKPFLGYGTGNVQKQLDPCYQEKGIDTVIEYNSHNQYFSILLVSGIAGLLVYLIAVFFIIKYFSQHKNSIAMAVLLFFLFNFLSENVLEREHGVLLYSFFICLFMFEKNQFNKSS